MDYLTEDFLSKEELQSRIDRFNLDLNTANKKIGVSAEDAYKNENVKIGKVILGKVLKFMVFLPVISKNQELMKQLPKPKFDPSFTTEDYVRETCQFVFALLSFVASAFSVYNASKKNGQPEQKVSKNQGLTNEEIMSMKRLLTKEEKLTKNEN